MTEEVVITEMEPAPISPTTPPVKQDLSGPLAADNTMQPVAESKSTFTKPAVNQSTSNQQVSSKTIQPMTETKKRKKRKKNNFKKLK